MADAPAPAEQKPGEQKPEEKPQAPDAAKLREDLENLSPEARAEALKGLVPEQKPEAKPEEKPEQKPAEAAPAEQPDVVKDTAAKVAKMEFENTIARKAPHLMEKIDDLNKIREKYPAMTPDEVIGYHLGSQLSNPDNHEGTTPHRGVGTPGGGTAGDTDYSKMSDQELFDQGQKELKESGFVR